MTRPVTLVESEHRGEINHCTFGWFPIASECVPTLTSARPVFSVGCQTNAQKHYYRELLVHQIPIIHRGNIVFKQLVLDVRVLLSQHEVGHTNGSEQWHAHQHCHPCIRLKHIRFGVLDEVETVSQTRRHRPSRCACRSPLRLHCYTDIVGFFNEPRVE